MPAVDVEHFGLVMGAEAHLRVLGPDAEAHLAAADARLAELESQWSRFLPDSDLSRVNRAGGEPVAVARDTADLIELAVAAWVLTEGRFDPSVLPALVAAGYDRTFTLLAARGPVPVGPGDPAPGCAGVTVVRDTGIVQVPDGVQLDLGGIGKGRGADLVATELLALGATGACVNLGGDVRVAGIGPEAGAWTIGVDHPFEPSSIVTLALREGAVATSTTAYRRWGDDAHHLIDPVTGLPARTDLAAVTVLAAEAVWAEVVAKAALLAGLDAAPGLIAGLGLTGLLVDTEGIAWTLPGLEEFVT